MLDRCPLEGRLGCRSVYTHPSGVLEAGMHTSKPGPQLQDAADLTPHPILFSGGTNVHKGRAWRTVSADRAQEKEPFREDLRLAVLGSGLLTVTGDSEEAGLSGPQEGETEWVG